MEKKQRISRDRPREREQSTRETDLEARVGFTRPSRRTLRIAGRYNSRPFLVPKDERVRVSTIVSDAVCEPRRVYFAGARKVASR